PIYYLRTLGDQGGGVDRDDRAHVPGGLGKRVGRSHAGQVGPTAERATARREDQSANLLRPSAAQALRQRRVLGVDRHDLVRALHRRLHERPTRDEGLLVGQRERAPGGER